jgi:hypothetical protein
VTGPLREELADYLALRRALGYLLDRPEKLPGQFLDYLEQAGEARITVTVALDWARLPTGGVSNWWAYRLSAVRGFATYLHGLDPAHERRSRHRSVQSRRGCGSAPGAEALGCRGVSRAIPHLRQAQYQQ